MLNELFVQNTHIKITPELIPTKKSDLQFSQNDVLDKLNLLWKFVKPISFALIGKEVLFSKLDAHLVGHGVLIVIVGSLVSHFPLKICHSIDLLRIN